VKLRKNRTKVLQSRQCVLRSFCTSTCIDSPFRPDLRSYFAHYPEIVLYGMNGLIKARRTEGAVAPPPGYFLLIIQNFYEKFPKISRFLFVKKLQYFAEIVITLSGCRRVTAGQVHCICLR
jgi:hypothetical protein